MALIADDAKHRAEQLLTVTERLTALIAEDARRIEARVSPLDGAEAEEKARLSNLYRLELARVKHDRSLIEAAPPALLAQLKTATIAMHAELAAYELALGAVKLVTEGMVQAMAEEVVRQRGGAANYAPDGGLASPVGPSPAVLDRSA